MHSPILFAPAAQIKPPLLILPFTAPNLVALAVLFCLGGVVSLCTSLCLRVALVIHPVVTWFSSLEILVTTHRYLYDNSSAARGIPSVSEFTRRAQRSHHATPQRESLETGPSGAAPSLQSGTEAAAPSSQCGNTEDTRASLWSEPEAAVRSLQCTSEAAAPRMATEAVAPSSQCRQLNLQHTSHLQHKDGAVPALTVPRTALRPSAPLPHPALLTRFAPPAMNGAHVWQINTAPTVCTRCVTAHLLIRFDSTC